ncbi:MAG: 3'(2'),5'-bisphosphate nucleotidase CysQ [Acidimicrobiales bacterium]
MDDHRLAASVADQAADLLVSIRPTASGAEADRRAHELIVASLAAARPGDAVLSEEGTDDASRLSARRVWIVDPLDGTREYTEGRGDWAVHVALWEDGELAAGAVALPADGVVLSTANPPPLPRPARSSLTVIVSRSRPPEVAYRVAAALDAEVIQLGSAGAKTAAVITGVADVYVHADGQYEWDSAAPVAVARAAGLHASRLDGSPLRYNQPDPYLPDLIICRPELAHRITSVTA